MQHATRHTRSIGIRAAARALGKNPATISRYVAANPALNHGSTGRPKVDLEELRRHRAANLNPSRIGSHAGRLLGEGDQTPVATAELPPAATGAAGSPNYLHAKAVRETVLAQRARVDLDEKRGLLVPRREIEDAIYDAGAVLQRDLLGLGPQLAERIAAMSDPREIAALMEAAYRKVLATLAASLRTKAAAEEEAHAAAEVVPHDPRLCP